MQALCGLQGIFDLFNCKTPEFSIPYHDRELTLNKLKLGKRDGKGTKIRG